MNKPSFPRLAKAFASGAVKKYSSKRPSVEDIRETFVYDPLLGEVRWKIDRSDGFAAGQKSSSTINVRGKTYLRVRFYDQSFMLSHVIWVLMKGNWPKRIKHKDGDSMNLKWTNLEA